MYGIELLVEEHENIIKFTKIMRGMCCDILEGKKVDVSKFRECIEFARNYADKHHHGKEEKVLFRIMLEELGAIADKVVRHGMLVEHDLGRYHVGELENALDNYSQKETVEEKLNIIVNATAYADLLKRHIEKEDVVAYSFAERTLSKELKDKVDKETKVFEEEAEKKGTKDKFLSWLNDNLHYIREEV